MGKVMRHTLGARLNIRHNLSSSKGPKPLQLKLLTTYIPKTSALTLAFSFFLQAEEGIGGLTVTGVQTCALPISGGVNRTVITRDSPSTMVNGGSTPPQSMMLNDWPAVIVPALMVNEPLRAVIVSFLSALAGEIGRASCRERV